MRDSANSQFMKVKRLMCQKNIFYMWQLSRFDKGLNNWQQD